MCEKKNLDDLIMNIGAGGGAGAVAVAAPAGGGAAPAAAAPAAEEKKVCDFPVFSLLYFIRLI